MPQPDLAGITAGTVLAAADALRERRGGTWTDLEVAVLIRLAYSSGRTDSCREDLAELFTVWEDHVEIRTTYERVVAARIESMRTVAGRARPDHPGGAVDWQSGRPLRHLHLVRDGA